MGCQNGTKVSRYERFARKPSLETLFAYEVVFGAPARELFAGAYQKVPNNFVINRLSAIHYDFQKTRFKQEIRKLLKGGVA